MIVNRIELGDALGISPAKVSAMQSQGIFPPVARGKYELSECIRAFIEVSVEHLMKKRPQSADEDTNLLYWKTMRMKHAALREMGITMQVEAAEKLMGTRLMQIRNVLTAVDSTWAPYLVGIKTVEESQKQLSKQLDKLFDQLSGLQDFEELDETDTPDITELELDEAEDDKTI